MESSSQNRRRWSVQRGEDRAPIIRRNSCCYRDHRSPCRTRYNRRTGRGDMTRGLVMSEEPPVSKLKLLIVGHEKNGKSRLAATGRKPILFHDFDDRAEALNGIPGVYVIPYPDPQWPM